MYRVAERISQLLKEQGLTVARFAREANVADGTLRKQLQRGSAIKPRDLERYADVLGVSVEFLLIGIKPSKSREISGFSEPDGDSDAFSCPVYQLSNASMREMKLSLSGLPLTKRALPVEYHDRRASTLFFLQVDDDDMAPSVKAGDLLIFDQQQQLNFDSKVCLTSLDGDVGIQRVRKIGKSISVAKDKPNFPAITIGPSEGARLIILAVAIGLQRLGDV